MRVIALIATPAKICIYFSLKYSWDFEDMEKKYSQKRSESKKGNEVTGQRQK